MVNIERYINDFLGNDPLQTYFVACSGGVDSMVVLHILHKLNKRVSALHVNYMLRGEDSEKDQQWVEEFCSRIGIPCHVKRVNLQQYLNKTGGNLQETARKVRYSYFENFKLKTNIRIVLGHHADDQVETFFLNLARGGGMMGLACMLPEHQQYLRPLLPFSKKEILQYARDEKLNWREDASNSSAKYNRNKLRNILLPEMMKAHPDLNDSVLTLVHAFQQTQMDLQSKMKLITDKIAMDGLLTFETYDQLNEFELNEIFRQLELSPTYAAELTKLRFAHIGKFIVSRSKIIRQIIVERNHFYFDKEDASLIPDLKLEMVKSLPLEFDKHTIYLNPDKIKGRMYLRNWTEGDRIKPIGLKGSKLISDILTDAKIPHHLRRKQLVLVDEEKVLWCVGFSISREAIAHANCEKLKVSLAE